MEPRDVFEQCLFSDENISKEYRRYIYQKERVHKKIFEKEERQQLIDDVANEVLARLSIKAETDGLTAEIESINRALDNLSK